MKNIVCKNYTVYINNWESFTQNIDEIDPSQIFILVDENTEKYCLHLLLEKLNRSAQVIRIPSGERYKNLDTCQWIWAQLLKYGAATNRLLSSLLLKRLSKI